MISFLHTTETPVIVLQGIEMHMSSGVEKVFVEMKTFLFILTGFYEVVKYIHRLGCYLTTSLVSMPLNFSVARRG